MKKRKFSSPYYAKDYFSKDILPTNVYAGRKTIRQPVPYRRHDELEFLLIRGGAGIVTVNARSFPVQRGSLLCFSPGHFHKLELGKGSKLEISECLVNSGVYFYITACPYYQSTAVLPTPPVYAQLDEARTEQTEKLIDNLASLCGAVPITENQPAFFQLMKLFGLLERYAVSDQPYPRPKDNL